MKTLSTLAVAMAAFAVQALAQTPTIPPPDIQIKTAVLAAPVEKRDGAMVYGYSPKNEFVILRKGTNELVCLADDPAINGLSVSCYHKTLEPFMQRGRDLKKEGKKTDEILKIREEEVKNKKLTMPSQPATLYVYTAKDEDYNPTSGNVVNGFLRYVVYIPYATAESTGLTDKPSAPGIPWLMDGGTHRAHIMITPAK